MLVNSPLSTEKSLGRMVNFWIVLVFDGQINSFLLIVVIASWIALMSLLSLNVADIVVTPKLQSAIACGSRSSPP